MLKTVGKERILAGLAAALALSLVVACGPASADAPDAAEEGLSAETGRELLIGIPNAGLFQENVLVGGQPTREHLAQAAAAGFRTVVNLRPAGELSEWDEEEVATELGLQYVSIPVPGAEGLSRANADRLRIVLDNAGNRPVLLHCSSGNRVGALLGLSAYYFQGASAEEALAIGDANGLTRLRGAVEQMLTNP